MKKLILFLLLTGFGWYACSPSLYTPVVSDPVIQMNLMKGRTLYVNHCGQCHNLHLPKEKTTEAWRKDLVEMQARAKITDEEKELIFNFLISEP